MQSIIGHSEVVKALDSSLASGKIGHAYLLLGPAGVGKKTLAKVFARKVLCLSPGKAVNCDCASCRRLESGSHPDFKIIEPQGNTIKIDQLRDVQHQAYLSPVMGQRKIFFFPEAEKLTDVAANSFLKLLEEAPTGIVFIFTAVRADSILPTIRSRCQVYQLFPVAISEIEQRLVGMGFDAAEAFQRSKLSQGLPGVALRKEGEIENESLWRISDLTQSNLLQLFKIAEELEKKDRKDIFHLLQKWEVELRKELITSENPDSITKAARALERLAESIMMCEYNVNIRLLLDDYFIYLKRLYP